MGAGASNESDPTHGSQSGSSSNAAPVPTNGSATGASAASTAGTQSNNSQSVSPTTKVVVIPPTPADSSLAVAQSPEPSHSGATDSSRNNSFLLQVGNLHTIKEVSQSRVEHSAQQPSTDGSPQLSGVRSADASPAMNAASASPAAAKRNRFLQRNKTAAQIGAAAATTAPTSTSSVTTPSPTTNLSPTSASQSSVTSTLSTMQAPTSPQPNPSPSNPTPLSVTTEDDPYAEEFPAESAIAALSLEYESNQYPSVAQQQQQQQQTPPYLITSPTSQSQSSLMSPISPMSVTSPQSSPVSPTNHLAVRELDDAAEQKKRAKKEKRANETPEERQERKAKKRAKKEKKKMKEQMNEQFRQVSDLAKVVTNIAASWREELPPEVQANIELPKPETATVETVMGEPIVQQQLQIQQQQQRQDGSVSSPPPPRKSVKFAGMDELEPLQESARQAEVAPAIAADEASKKKKKKKTKDALENGGDATKEKKKSSKKKKSNSDAAPAVVSPPPLQKRPSTSSLTRPSSSSLTRPARPSSSSLTRSSTVKPPVPQTSASPAKARPSSSSMTRPSSSSGKQTASSTAAASATAAAATISPVEAVDAAPTVLSVDKTNTDQAQQQKQELIIEPPEAADPPPQVDSEPKPEPPTSTLSPATLLLPAPSHSRTSSTSSTRSSIPDLISLPPKKLLSPVAQLLRSNPITWDANTPQEKEEILSMEEARTLFRTIDQLLPIVHHNPSPAKASNLSIFDKLDVASSSTIEVMERHAEMERQRLQQLEDIALGYKRKPGFISTLSTNKRLQDSPPKQTKASSEAADPDGSMNEESKQEDDDMQDGEWSPYNRVMRRLPPLGPTASSVRNSILNASRNHATFRVDKPSKFQKKYWTLGSAEKKGFGSTVKRI